MGEIIHYAVLSSLYKVDGNKATLDNQQFG